MARILDISDGYTSATEPTLGTVEASALRQYASDAAYVTAKGAVAADGDIYYNTATDVVRVYANGAWTSLPDDATVVHKTGDESIAGDKTFSDDVIISGDLTVNGTNTILNVSTVESEDQNILVNKGGTDGTSEGAGLTVARTGTSGSFIYADAASSKWKCGALGTEKEIVDLSSGQTLTNKTIAGGSNTISGLTHGSQVDNPTSGVHGATGTIVGTSDTQVLTNKDIDGGTAADTRRITLPKDTTSNLNGLTRKQGTMVFDTTVNRPKFDNGSALTEFGSGSGSGRINYITNGTFEDDITGWNLFDDGATLDNGTGGSASYLAISRNTSDPIHGLADLKIAKSDGFSALGEGVSYDFTVTKMSVGNMVDIEFNYWFSNSDMPDDAFEIWLYSVDGSKLLQPTPYQLKVSTVPSKFKAQIQLDYNATTTSADQYRLVIFCNSADTDDVDLFIDNVLAIVDVPGAS
jgi:hypothetical protein